MANDADADHEPSAVVRSVTVEQIAGDADAPEPSNVEWHVSGSAGSILMR